MARRGRPPKQLSQADRSRIDLADDIINSLTYNANLSPDQVEVLKRTLDDTFKSYDFDKHVDLDNPDEHSIKDINSEALNAFVQSKRAEGRSKTTLYNYSNELGKLFSVINKDYRTMTAQDILEYLDYRRTNDNVKMSTVQNVRLYLMSFYKWAFINERVQKNPMDKIGTIKTEKKVIDTFTDEEVEMLRCACKNERDLAIVDMLSSSGMRVSELTGLNRDDVNFETGEVKVYGKGSKERICFLTGRAKIHLKWYLDKRNDDNPALFVTAKKPYTRITKNGVEFALKELGKQSGVDVHGRIYPHRFRSTVATNLLNKGADIAVVQGLLGHQSPETTIQVYASMKTDTLKSAHNKYMS